MRTHMVVGVVALLTLSGCLGFGDEDENGSTQTQTQTDDCPDATTATPESSDDAMTGNATLGLLGPQEQANMTSGDDCPGPVATGPNELPDAVLNMTGPDGPIAAGSAIEEGTEVTFSAAASSDPDGEIALAAIEVTDANSTRNANLYADGGFVDATLRFDHVGSITIKLRILDDRGEGILLNQSLAVNLIKSFDAEVPVPFPGDDVSTCSPGESSTGQTLTRDEHWFEGTFIVNAGAKWISVESTGDESVGICTPDGTSLGSGTGSAESDGEAALAAGATYKVVATPDGPNDTFTLTVTVHYEAKP